MSVLTKVVVCLPFVALAGCSSSGAPLGGSSGVANGYAVVSDAGGNRIGVALLTQGATGTVRVRMLAHGLAAGVHGVHFHAIGLCEPPAFMSSGGHFNPGARHHGLANPAGPHAGDLPNITVDATGNADYDVTTDRVSLTPGTNGLFDSDGSALVIHAAPDDNMTDPAGNAGARIGCGVIHSGTAPG
jgi:Cu-Zn family superoxide dismutase